jgi:mannosyltransferase OCH1-like enzyme
MYLDDVVLNNPEYTQIYFDDTDCENFIRDFFPGYLSDYQSLIPTAFKADLWRLLVIYKYGGIYSDIGHMFVQKVDKIISHSDQLVFCVDSVPESLHNAFFASVAGSPVIKALIDYTVNNIRNRNYGEDPLDITGPMAWGKCIRKLFRLPLNSAFAPGTRFLRDQYMNSYTIRFIKFFAYIWKDPRNCILNTDNEKVIVTKFPNYYNIMYTDRNVKHYGELWKLRNVFNETHSTHSYVKLNSSHL